ncbi:membrane protein [Zafaria cholistanensis]|uniref:Membrane protein n=1 Tax=Zafaria cholistanensis TaxID=1682741 RepID=A0A5A7NS03_9MICC|nr:ABC transporter permease [Zafaria cholistanensis]GER22737.1 membrane protein [Zafaria cholistanensis]
MFARYLRRELSGRRKQTAIIATAMALAIGLVIIVNSLSAGVRNAQAGALESVYGVGTDVTVTATPSPPAEGERGPRFEFGAGDGSDTGDGTTAVSQSRLATGRGSATFDAAAVGTVTAQDGVEAASGVLSLTNMTFDGELPQAGGTAGTGTAASGAEEGQAASSRAGGSFDVNSFTVMGVDGNAGSVGPLASATLQDGRTLQASDAGTYTAVLDSAYATTEELAVGDAITIADQEFEVAGIVAGSGSDAETASNAYIPLDVAQELSGSAGLVSTVYVRAASSDRISTLKDVLEAALPENTVNTQEDLASSVSGSLSTASGLVSSLGTWLSAAVLAVAFLLAILLTISGVSRRTREFGTLKAIGWRNGSIVRQVAGESLVQSLIGGAAGLLVGLAGILLVNAFSPTLTASARAQAAGPAGGPGGLAQRAGAAADVVLHAPLTPAVMLIAVGAAVAGGLLAGVLGGWRAARLRPAAALRSVA